MIFTLQPFWCFSQLFAHATFYPKKLEIIVFPIPFVNMPFVSFSYFYFFLSFFNIWLSPLLFLPLHYVSQDLVKILFYFFPLHSLLYRIIIFQACSFSSFLSLVSLSPAEGVYWWWEIGNVAWENAGREVGEEVVLQLFLQSAYKRLTEARLCKFLLSCSHSSHP